MDKPYNNANEARRRASEARQERARALREQGWTTDAIAVEIGVTRPTINRMLRGNYRALCVRKANAAQRKAEAVAEIERHRHTVSGRVRGCPTTVTADTVERAQSMLQRMTNG